MSDEEGLARRAKALEWLLFDVDGVLTDGQLIYTRRGEQVKLFNVRDGLGFRLAQQAGLKLGILSGRRSKPLEKRATELDFDAVCYGSHDKNADFDRFLSEQKTTAEQVAFIGDDLPDLPVLARCGWSFAPADAVPEVLARVQTVLRSRGGEGAARELIERVLAARGEWERVVERFGIGMPPVDTRG
ncbi:MAG: HAD hydrolase family protein [Thermoanaerobaculia bacterium]|nr:HAD hydrolase family protein [Thermoanaerobaculia bacterium]